MNEISAMPSNIAKWLDGRDELAAIRFLTEFPPIRKAVPLRKITVAVGIGSIVIEDSFESSDENPLEEGEEYCRQAEIELKFSVHAPYSMGGAACHETFADIIDCLTFDSGLEITESGCGSITEDRDTEAFVLTSYAKVKATLCPAQSGNVQFPSFLDKTLLCGSHIRDESIHLSESRQEWLREPFVCGMYYGTGAASRSFDLGFKPSAVIVAAGDMPPVMTDGEYGKVIYGIAVTDGGTIGLEITDSGFRVKNGSTYAFQGSYPGLNDSGLSFAYAAFRGAPS